MIRAPVAHGAHRSHEARQSASEYQRMPRSSVLRTAVIGGTHHRGPIQTAFRLPFGTYFYDQYGGIPAAGASVAPEHALYVQERDRSE